MKAVMGRGMRHVLMLLAPNSRWELNEKHGCESFLLSRRVAVAEA